MTIKELKEFLDTFPDESEVDIQITVKTQPENNDLGRYDPYTDSFIKE